MEAVQWAGSSWNSQNFALVVWTKNLTKKSDFFWLFLTFFDFFWLFFELFDYWFSLFGVFLLKNLTFFLHVFSRFGGIRKGKWCVLWHRNLFWNFLTFFLIFFTLFSVKSLLFFNFSLFFYKKTLTFFCYFLSIFRLKSSLIVINRL